MNCVPTQCPLMTQSGHSWTMGKLQKFAGRVKEFRTSS
jgi:hypothetical protein